ncbi:MAG: DsrE family protein [Gammaproteobacteria bacterium]|nr:DsrE family protein [Gammaproteobacteria bacterium]
MALFAFTAPITFATEELDARLYPELDEILEITNGQERPQGVVFVIYEYDYDAMEWISPRLLKYVELLRERFEELPISVVAHGDEILSLTTDQKRLYPQVHGDIEELVQTYKIHFHVCGAYAAFNGLSEEDFPSYIDVVPFGPSQIADYRMVGYELIDLALTW